MLNKPTDPLDADYRIITNAILEAMAMASTWQDLRVAADALIATHWKFRAMNRERQQFMQENAGSQRQRGPNDERAS